MHICPTPPPPRKDRIADTKNVYDDIHDIYT